MNILILSAGTRNKVVQYFVKTLNGKGTVVATDMSNLAPAIYEADKYYIVPRMTDPGYLDVILDICKKEKITGVLSLIDPELSLLAENREKFEAVGTTVIVIFVRCPWINLRCITGWQRMNISVLSPIWTRMHSLQMLRLV